MLLKLLDNVNVNESCRAKKNTAPCHFSPVPCHFFASVNGAFVSDALNELLEGDRISEVQCRHDLHVIIPLSVSVQPSGKNTLILDLRLDSKCLYQEEGNV